MDPSAYMSREQWQVILDESSWNLVELRDKYLPSALSISPFLTFL